MDILEQADPEVAAAIAREEVRQRLTLEMIASENYTSAAVLAAAGSVLTNKYAEGYPGKRYYGGCQFVDQVEELARTRAKQLFGADHANVQPHSGAQANLAAYFAFLEPGDPVMGMTLSHGGHLTHGSPVNFTGKTYAFYSYGVDRETENIDYGEMRRIALEVHPKIIVVGATAYPRIIDFARCREIATEAASLLMVDMAHIAGLVAAGVHPSPVPFADIVTSTTHKTLRGPRSGFILAREDHAAAIDRAVFPGMQGGPLMHIIAAKAVAFGEALQPGFRHYAQQIVANAQALADGLLGRGLRLVSGGTDNHLLLVDVGSKGMSGKKAEWLLDEVGITVNKNTIPYDERSPTITSGIRVGTAALTTRGFGPDEMRRIAGFIADVLEAPDDAAVAAGVSGEVRAMAESFPVPGIRTGAKASG